MAKKSEGSGRVTPKGTGSPSSPAQRQRPNMVAIVLVVLVLAGLVAGTAVSMVGGVAPEPPVTTLSSPG